MNKPKKIDLANLPTPIFDFQCVNNNKSFSNLYIKRDDFTGMEMSGNKVRKLEFSLKQALDENANVFITCGGIQSNHCRATAAAAAKLNKKSHLLLRGEACEAEGNLFLDKLFGAEITYITPEQYKNNRGNIMESIKADYKAAGLNAYILPEGASNGIGMFGYYNAYEEILEQEKYMGLTFDTICIADGSGGTYSGLYAANEVYGKGKNIVGFNIYDKNADVAADVSKIIAEAAEITGYTDKISMDNMHIINKYVGEGYAIASDEVVDNIIKIAGATGIVFDPVYTGKAVYGILAEIRNQNELFKGNVLFIHTGGIFGVFPQRKRFM